MTLAYRAGTRRDGPGTFGIAERALHQAAIEAGVLPDDAELSEETIAASWERHRALIEFLDAQPDARMLVAEDDSGPVAFARAIRFGAMDELTDLMVDPALQGQGVGRELLDRLWPGDPSPEMGRLVVATGAPRDLSLYMDYGVMPVAGHWHMRQSTERYLEHRSQEIDVSEPGVHMLTPERAVTEWKRLEPPALSHERPELHDFFGRDRICLATMDGDHAAGVCWVSGQGEIGPAVASTPEGLVPLVLAAFDRVAKTQEPESLGVYVTSTSWWLLHRLRLLGFRVFWPSWIMCSVPLPGLDRYVPTRPPNLL